MKVHLPSSLLARLAVVQLGLLSLVWSGIVGLSLYQTYQSGAGAIDADLRLIAQALARLTRPGASPAEAARLAQEIRDINAEASAPDIGTGEFAFQIWTADGRLLARSREIPAMRELRPGALPIGRSAREPGWIALGEWSRDRRVYAVSAQSVEFYSRVQRDLIVALATPYLFMIVTLFAILWLTLRYVLKPLRTLAAGINARRPDELSPFDASSAFTELQPLIGALNEKLQRIESMRASERQFFTDAAHELRTPLSVIGAQAHVLAHESRPESRLAALATIEGGIDRAARVVGRLLLLGRLEAAPERVSRQMQDLAAVAAAVVGAHRARARSQGQALLLAGATSLLCDFDIESISVAIENLVDNAIRYTPPGSTILVEVERDASHCVVRVCDDGPGVAAEDRQRIFDRFQRLGSEISEGSGLGLAIVRRICELHGGSVNVTDPAQGLGAVFELRLPADHG